MSSLTPMPRRPALQRVLGPLKLPGPDARYGAPGLVCPGAMAWVDGMLRRLFAVLMAPAYASFRSTAAQRAAAAPDDPVFTPS